MKKIVLVLGKMQIIDSKQKKLMSQNANIRSK